MFLTDKGETTVEEAAALIDRVFNANQTEARLAKYLGIDRVIIAPGDSDRQQWVFDLMGEQLNSALDLLLPLGQNIITVLGGETIARIVNQLNPKLRRNRQLLFVPGRGALGQSSIELQSDSLVQMMARKTGGQYKSLNLPEQVSVDAYRELIRDPAIEGVLADISRSDAVIHGIGIADEMARRRGFDSIALSKLHEKNAVVECFGCFFNQHGKIVERIPRLGLQLSDLAKIPHVFAIAAGARKARAIVSYMHHAPHQTWLITDEGASNLILKGSHSRLK